jgi:hypothetical protein
MQLYTATQEFYMGNLYYRYSFDFTRISEGEVIGVLSGSPSTYIKGEIVAGLPMPGAYQYLVAGAVVPDPAVPGAGVPRSPVGIPASHDAPGEQGTWAFDGTYYYWAVANNQWVRMVSETVFP